MQEYLLKIWLQKHPQVSSHSVFSLLRQELSVGLSCWESIRLRSAQIMPGPQQVVSMRQLTKAGTVTQQAPVPGCAPVTASEHWGPEPGKSQSLWLQDDLYWEGWERSMDDVAANYTEKGRCGATYIGSRSNAFLEVSMVA